MGYKDYLKELKNIKPLIKKKSIKEPKNEEQIKEDTKNNKQEIKGLNRNKQPIGWANLILEGVSEFNPPSIEINTERKAANEITKDELKDPAKHASHLL